MDHRIEKTNHAHTVILRGHFTFADNQLFRQLMNQLIEQKPKKVVFDFEHVTYIDSAALGMLLLLKERLEESSIGLVLARPKDHVAKMFNISKFETLFAIET